MLTSRRHITERYVVLPNKDLRHAFSSLQGDVQLTLAYDMMITAANKNDGALQQPLTTGPRSHDQGPTGRLSTQLLRPRFQCKMLDPRSQVSGPTS